MPKPLNPATARILSPSLVSVCNACRYNPTLLQICSLAQRSLSQSEILLFSPVFCKLFYRTLQSNVSPLRLKVINSVRAKIQNSHDHLSQILAGIPPDWRLDSSYLTDRLSFLFTDEWISECEKSFDTYLQISLNHR